MSRGTPISFSADMHTEATDKFISLSSLSPASPVRLSSPFDERLRRELPQVRCLRWSFVRSLSTANHPLPTPRDNLDLRSARAHKAPCARGALCL